MSERSPELLIDDILTALDRIARYTKGMSEEQFVGDDRTVDATIRNIEIIGEAAGRLSESFRAQHPETEWTRIRGLRNRIAHAYFGIDLALV
jgi:uncharacterized protein with HEPN domain